MERGQNVKRQPQSKTLRTISKALFHVLNHTLCTDLRIHTEIAKPHYERFNSCLAQHTNPQISGIIFYRHPR